MLHGVHVGMLLWESLQARVFTVFTVPPPVSPHASTALCFCFAATAASSWKVKASSRTRSQCAPPTTRTRWPARGCLRWRRTAGAAPPSRSNPEPHIQVRIEQRSLWSAGSEDDASADFRGERPNGLQLGEGSANWIQCWHIKNCNIIAPIKVMGIFAPHEKIFTALSWKPDFSFFDV